MKKNSAKINLPPKVLEALVSAGAGGIAGTLLGGVSASLIPSKFDITSSEFRLDGTPRKRKQYVKTYKRDPIGQALRSGLVGMAIGGTKPFVEEPIRRWLESKNIIQS